MNTLLQKLNNSSTVGIWGYGLSGQSYLRFLQTYFPHLSLVVIDKTMPKNLASSCSFISQETLAEHINTIDLLMPSPGIKPSAYKPYQDKLLSELDLFGLFYKGKSVAITGSIGKTSTTSLITHILNENGVTASSAGNIGYPLLDLILCAYNHSDHWAVIELSSAQLTLPHNNFHPTIAILTNLYANHLDWHGTLEAYRSAKYSLFTSEQTRAHLIPKDEQPFYQKYKTNAQCILIDTQKLELDSALNRIPTSKENRFCAQTVCSLLGIANPTCVGWIAPAHRIEYIGKLGSYECFNDSKATIMESVSHAVELLLEQYEHLHLILGGLSKGVDRTPAIKKLVEQYGAQVTFYCFGKEAPLLAEIIRQENHDCSISATLDEVLKELQSTTQKEAPGAIVLSPGGSSFDLYTDYQERGNHFKKIISQ